MKNHENRSYRADYMPYSKDPSFNDREERYMKPNMPLSSLCSIKNYWQWYALTILLPSEIKVQTPETGNIYEDCNNPGMLTASNQREKK
jgi:hypothetical protein